MNADKKKARNKRYYEKHKDEILIQAKSSYEKKILTPEQKIKHAQRQKQYYLENKEVILERNKLPKKNWYILNKERILEGKKKWRKSQLGSLEYRFKRALQTAKQRHIPFLLSFEDYKKVVEQPCYYCGFKLCSQVVEGSGLDRIDSNKGYQIDNVVSCGHRCNMIKNDDLTMEEAKAAIEAILKIRLKVIAQNESKSARPIDTKVSKPVEP